MPKLNPEDAPLRTGSIYPEPYAAMVRGRSSRRLGDLAGLPSAQINRTITGAQALADGETDNPAALAFGFQKPR